MGLRSGLRAAVPFLAVFLAAATASALEAPGFGELRASYPQVDRAIDSMPDSGLHGSFNRISALLHSAPVRDLPAGSSDSVPENVGRNLARAIDQLSERLVPDIDGLSSASDRFVLLQTTTLVVFNPIQELYSDAEWEFCPEPSAACDSPEVLASLDRLAQELIPVYWSLLQVYEEAASSDSSLPAITGIRPDEDFNSQEFGSIIDDMAGFLGLVHGEPIID